MQIFFAVSTPYRLMACPVSSVHLYSMMNNFLRAPRVLASAHVFFHWAEVIVVKMSFWDKSARSEVFYKESSNIHFLALVNLFNWNQ